MDILLFGSYTFEAPFVDRWKRRHPEFTGKASDTSTGFELVRALIAFRASAECVDMRRRADEFVRANPQCTADALRSVRRDLWREVMGE